MALGAGVTALSLTALAALHLFGHQAIRLFTILEAAAALTVALIKRRELRAEIGARVDDRTRVWGAAVLVLGVILLATFIATCAPPSAMDATVYHLYAPAEFLRTGTWTKLDEVQSFQPLYVEMLFAQGLAIGGGPLAALVHWLLGVGAIGAAACWARRFGARGLWAAVMFGGSALWVWESTSAFIDLALGLFASLSLLFAVSSELGGAAVCLAGVFGGLAGGTKFTGVVLAALSGGVAFARSWPDRKVAFRSLLVVGTIALLVASPWYIRDALLTGNPFFPLANKVFGLPPQPLASMTYGLGTDLLHLLSSPFDLLARGENFDQGWALGPAYLAFAPVGWVLLRSRRSHEAALVGAYALAWWLIWFYSSPQTRLLVPMLPMLAGLGAVAIDALLASRRALRLVTVCILGVELTGGLAAAALYLRTAGPVVLGKESADSYLRRTSWNYVAYKLTEKLLPADARIAVTGSANNLYYFDRPAHWLGKLPVSTARLAAAGFEYELRVLPCPLEPLDDPRRMVVSEGDFPLPASRAAGGIYAQACYRLSTVSPASAGASH
ncbi:MAG TPA: hypothetical protein VN962_24030 [Polyangia bacterium]|nr:hypothetical protein [Polyangia bacterium]